MATAAAASAPSKAEGGPVSVQEERIAMLLAGEHEAAVFYSRLNTISMSGVVTETTITEINTEIPRHRKLKSDANMCWFQAKSEYLADGTKKSKAHWVKIGHIKADIEELLSLIEERRARIVLKLRKDKDAEEFLDNLEGQKNKWDSLGKIGWIFGSGGAGSAIVFDRQVMSDVGLSQLYQEIPKIPAIGPVSDVAAALGIAIGVLLIARERLQHHAKNRNRKKLSAWYLDAAEAKTKYTQTK